MISYDTGCVNELSDVDDLQRVNILLSDLYSNIMAIDKKALRDFSEFPNTRIVIARDSNDKGDRGLAAKHGQIVGMGIVTIIRKWGYRYAFVEDIIVKENYRGKAHGIADAILARLNQIAKDSGAKQSDLTCNPTRLAAHKVYERNGYKKRDTISYRKPHNS